MIRLITDRKDIKEKEHLNDFFSRLKLLIIMSKAFLGNYPLEKHRLEEIVKAAEQVIKDCVEWKGRYNNFRSDMQSEDIIKLDHIFFQRVKLLSTMAKSFAQGNPMGQYRRIALKENIHQLCESLRYTPQEVDPNKSRVA